MRTSLDKNVFWKRWKEPKIQHKKILICAVHHIDYHVTLLLDWFCPISFWASIKGAKLDGKYTINNNNDAEKGLREEKSERVGQCFGSPLLHHPLSLAFSLPSLPFCETFRRWEEEEEREDIEDIQNDSQVDFASLWKLRSGQARKDKLSQTGPTG